MKNKLDLEAAKLLAELPLPTRTDFKKIASDALLIADVVCMHWLPDGHMEGNEFLALNPHRQDINTGSFKINLVTGKWADFAVAGAKGGDLISLVAYLEQCSQSEAAQKLVEFLEK